MSEILSELLNFSVELLAIYLLYYLEKEHPGTQDIVQLLVSALHT